MVFFEKTAVFPDATNGGNNTACQTHCQGNVKIPGWQVCYAGDASEHDNGKNTQDPKQYAMKPDIEQKVPYFFHDQVFVYIQI